MLSTHPETCTSWTPETPHDNDRGEVPRDANLGGLSASTLSFSNSSGTIQAYLAFDSSQNLWVADAGNNRVLRFPVSAFGSAAKNGPAADLVLGQLDFNTTSGTTDATNLLFLNAPTGIVFDQQGRLFVSESPGGSVRSRILIYTPPFLRSGQPATRIIGVVPSTVTPQPPQVSEQQFSSSTGDLFLINNGVGIADAGNNRLLGFRPVEQFTSNVLTQQAQFQYLFGQPDFSSRLPNQGMPETGPDRLANPTAVAASGTELFIADTSNNRVISVPYSSVFVGQATRVIGQDSLSLNAPNLVEGREFRFLSGSGAFEAGIVADQNSNPPHLYVADTYNNRILGFRDLRTIKPGDRADVVIGQPDFFHTAVNYPSNNPDLPNASGLFAPTGLAVDSSGNLFVADTLNGRVLRFANPFANPGFLPNANLVLGQRNFTSKILDASQNTMAAPYGLAFATANGLLVSDTNLNRVLFFNGSPDSLTNGQAAQTVFGQPDFTSSAATGNSAADNRFSGPRGIATDVDDRLYVSDFGNGRVVIFERAPSQQNDPRSSRTLTGLSGVRGVAVNRSNGEVWVAAGSADFRFPTYVAQPLTGFQPNATIPDGGVLAITLDAYGNLYTADASNRVQINYPALAAFNAASLQSFAGFAPGSIASIFSLFDKQFGTATAQASGSPLPKQLANVQVLFNNAPVPLYYVGPNQINFVLPNSAPTSGTADLLVSRSDTGQILGNFPIPLNVASPALFVINSTTPGAGQVAAVNQDGTINGKDHPALNGSTVSFFGTGEGFVPGAPPDGVGATGPVPTASKPMVIIGTTLPGFVPDENITYSGLAPGFPGLWQVNVKIPDIIAATSVTGNITPVVFVVNGIASNGPTRLQTTMWVTGKSN